MSLKLRQKAKLDRAARKPARRRILPSRRRRIARRVLFCALVLLVIFVLSALALYLNRLIVYESVIKRVLRDQGYDAALMLDSATLERAVIKDITLGKNGEVFARAQQITAIYDWEQLRSGNLLALDITGLYVKATLDARGQITSDWIPKAKSKGSAGLAFPKGGVRLTGLSADITSPYGNAQVRGDVGLRSYADFTANLTFDSEALQSGGYSAAAQGRLSAKTDPQARSFDPHSDKGLRIDLSGTQVSLLNIMGPKGPAKTERLGSADVKLGGSLALPAQAGEAITYDGKANITAVNFDGPYFASRSALLGFDGHAAYAPKTQTVLASKFEVQASLKGLSLTDPAQRKALASRLTLETTLARAPVAGGFISGITAQVEGLLARADWSGRVGVDYRADGYEIALLAPLDIKGQQSRAALSPQSNTPVFIYDKANHYLTLQSHIALSGSRALQIRDFTVSGQTDSGYLWSRVDSVFGNIMSGQTWQDGPARLAPFIAKLTYKNGRTSSIRVAAAIDYDGPLLGADFTGLKTKGDLSVVSSPQGLRVNYTASDPILASNVITPVGYRAQDLSLKLRPEGLSFKRSKLSDALKVSATSLTTRLINQDGGRADIFDVSVQDTDISGLMNSQDQTWDIHAQDARIISDTTPGPDTRFRSPELSLTLSRAPDQPWHYDMQAQDMSADVGPASVKSLDVRLSGTPKDLTLHYEGGTALLEGANLPPLPVKGEGYWLDGRFTGKAITSLPKVSQFPIYADYFFENGVGGAVLDVPQLVFAPASLQPQDLAPALKGKIASVEGLASAKVTLGYTAGQPLTSKGSVTLTDLNIGTLVGPFTGVNAVLTFDSLYPLRSSSPQTITMQSFDPGLPLGVGAVTFQALKGGIQLLEARWPMGGGDIFASPTFWSTTGEANRITVSVSDISLGDIVQSLGNEDLSATGQIEGSLPILVDGVNLTVENGRVEIEDGGVITVRSKGLNRAGDENEVAKIAIDALKDFRYEKLTLDINGPLDGNMTLGAKFIGQNPEVLGGAQFLFRTSIEGELINIARNLTSNTQMNRIKDTLEKSGALP